MYAYTLPKKDTAAKTTLINGGEKNAKDDKILRLQTNLLTSKQDLLTNLKLGFSKKIQSFDTTKITLADTNFKPISGYKVIADTINNSINITLNWPPNTFYKLIVDSAAAKDTMGHQLVRNDTISFATKKLEDYGSVKLRFANLERMGLVTGSVH